MTGAARRQASTAHPRIQGDLASDRDVGGGSFDLVTRMECSFFRPATSCGMGQGRNDDGDLQELNFLTVSSSLRFLQRFYPLCAKCPLIDSTLFPWFCFISHVCDDYLCR
ncbi:hypothetical protein PVAP13_4KG020500 [Panicum virgatum]|uniref:Uncharacterized protein n=1 Tax=Panicum virgatum TaxID=38727 RepID=A0A8T0TJF7_PANVG|nr:hypothetical protein PVAP13_4KG020500 [Panicum virgatum]